MSDLVVMTEYATLDSYTIGTRACFATNIHVLWNGPSVRGKDRRLPGAAGVRAYKRRTDITPVTLKLFVDGAWQRDGTANADARVGLQTNWFDLRTITDPYSTGDGTRTLTLHLPSGTKSAAVHVEHLGITERHQSWLLAELDLTIPLGALA